MKHSVLSGDRLQRITYSEEDGKQIVSHQAELAPHIRRVEYLRQVGAYATRKSNPNGWRHKASVPFVVIMDWCRKNNVRFDQWARNEGGAKDRFLKFFLSRDFSKLHNEHVTTKPSRSAVTIPRSILRNALDLTGIGQ